MKNLFIVKRITEDTSISDNAFLVWCGLRSMMKKGVSEYNITYYILANFLYGRTVKRKELIAIRKGYQELKAKGYVKELSVYPDRAMKIDLTKLYFKQRSEYFSDLTDEEMQKILNIECTVSKAKLLRYFTCMIGTFNRSEDIEEQYRGKVGGLHLDYFHNLIGISKQSVINYNKILEENKLLFIIRHKDFYQNVNEKGQSVLREIPNTYSRWCDKELAIKFSESTYGYIYFTTQKDIATTKANKNRSLAQKYLNFCHGKEYNIETIREMYSYCYEWNKNQLAYHNTEISKGYKHELVQKDMSVFDDYLIDICTEDKIFKEVMV